MSWDTQAVSDPVFFITSVGEGTFLHSVSKNGAREVRGAEDPQQHCYSNLLPLSPPGQWMALPDFPDYHKWGFSLAALNSDVYVTGGWPRAPKDSLINLVLLWPLQPTLLPNRSLESLLRPSRPFYTSESEGFPGVEMGGPEMQGHP